MSLVALEPRTGTRTVPARGLTYHSPVTSSSSSSSEGEWIAQVADGDADAFARLYDAWSSRLFALILQIVVDRAQSEEVLQEVFLEVWRTAGSFSPTRGSARAWLVTMARRRAIDRVRSSQSSRDWERRDRHIMCDAANKKLAFGGLASVLTNVSACGAIVRPAAVSQAFVPRLGESRTAPVMVRKNGECFFSCCMENSGNSCPAIRPIRCGAHLDSAFRGHLQHEESGPMLDCRSLCVR